MKPAPFDYLKADSLSEAAEALAEAGEDGRVIAGGQSLMPMLNMRLAKPSLLVDIMGVDELGRIAEEKDTIRIGAGVRQAKLQAWDGLSRHLPLVAAALPWVGHAQTRSRGTVCGSVAHADPSAELPLVLTALKGGIVLRARRRTRTVSASDFFLGMMATDLKPGEMIESVSFPKAAPSTGYAFREIGRRHGDFAIVACAAVVDASEARLAVGGVADRPMVRTLPLPVSGDFDDALNEFAWALNARDDLHASARYRRELVRRLGRQSLEEAARCRA
ncbi:FAD binding domain-containing protein [Amorphus coralli]|uniref:FAD binding domain-containing protein n=1 Tax=Amorphus coralli TaxID=340680 RepID=UPI0003602859|nr:FAD binding domain-containing protein [Amorphus coralli]